LLLDLDLVFFLRSLEQGFLAELSQDDSFWQSSGDGHCLRSIPFGHLSFLGLRSVQERTRLAHRLSWK
jgi:hypothetical protein